MFPRNFCRSRGLGDDLKNAAESVATSKVTGAIFDGIADLFEREDFDLTYVPSPPSYAALSYLAPHFISDRGVGTDIKNVAEGVASSEAGDLIFDGILALFVRGELGQVACVRLLNRAIGINQEFFRLQERAHWEFEGEGVKWIDL